MHDYTPTEASALISIAALMFAGLTVVTLCVVHWATIVELVR